MTYRYRKLGDYLVRADQAISEALRIFLFGYSRHRLDSLGMSRSTARKIVLVALIRRFRRTSPSLYVTLPVRTQLGMRVHRGYKMFDFDRSEVTKVFSADVTAQEASHEISSSEKASLVPSAPRFLEADVRGRWFKEEYIRGTHATKLVTANSSDYRRYYKDAEKCLLDLASCSPATPVSVRSHIDKLANIDFRERWLQGGASVDEVDRLVDYVAKLSAWLIDNSESDVIQLVPTHGDFSLVNAIATNAGLRFIDWEGVSTGGVFSDILNFAFVERYYGRAAPEFPAEVAAMLARYRTALSDHCRPLTSDASISDHFARRLYYLERTRFLIERQVTPNQRQVISKSMAMFMQFDAETGDTQV